MQISGEYQELNKHIGAVIAELRKNRNLTQKELASILNISISTLAHYEQGVTPPPVSMLYAISNLFNVPTDYIFGKCQNKVEYKKMNELVSDDLSIGDLVNIVSSLSGRNKKYLADTLKLLTENKL